MRLGPVVSQVQGFDDSKGVFTIWMADPGQSVGMSTKILLSDLW